MSRSFIAHDLLKQEEEPSPHGGASGRRTSLPNPRLRPQPRGIGDVSDLPCSMIAWNIPMLVLGGSLDRIVPTSEIARMAEAYGAERKIHPVLAYDPMLVEGWEQVAESLLDWLLRCFQQGTLRRRTCSGPRLLSPVCAALETAGYFPGPAQGGLRPVGGRASVLDVARSPVVPGHGYSQVRPDLDPPTVLPDFSDRFPRQTLPLQPHIRRYREPVSSTRPGAGALSSDKLCGYGPASLRMRSSFVGPLGLQKLAAGEPAALNRLTG